MLIYEQTKKKSAILKLQDSK